MGAVPSFPRSPRPAAPEAKAPRLSPKQNPEDAVRCVPECEAPKARNVSALPIAEMSHEEVGAWLRTQPFGDSVDVFATVRE